jgi:hypothetical protein
MSKSNNYSTSDLAAVLEAQSERCDIKIGDTIYIRLLGCQYIGQLVGYDHHGYRLAPCYWVKHPGDNYGTMLSTGKVKELHAYPPDTWPVLVREAPAQDVCRWPHPLPK